MGKDPGRNSITWNVHTWHSGESWSQEYRWISYEHWETQWLSSEWKCNLMHGPFRNLKRQIQGRGRGQRTTQWDRIPVNPLGYITADPRFTFGGTEGSCERISPNCPHKLEFLVGKLAQASWLCLASGVGGLVLQWGLPKSPSWDTAWLKLTVLKIVMMEPVFYGSRLLPWTTRALQSQRAWSSTSSSPGQVRIRVAHVNCLDKHVEQDDGRESAGWEAEFQERIPAKWREFSWFQILLPASSWTGSPDLENSV